MNTYRIIDQGVGAIDIQGKTLKSALNKRYGRNWQYHATGRNSPHFDVVRKSKYGGYDVLARVPKGQED